MDNESGVYETIYGNACKYRKGDETAYDIDSAERIPVEMIDFEKYIGSLSDY